MYERASTSAEALDIAASIIIKSFGP